MRACLLIFHLERACEGATMGTKMYESVSYGRCMINPFFFLGARRILKTRNLKILILEGSFERLAVEKKCKISF